MSTPDNSYHRLLIAFRERNQYNSVFQRSLDELSGKVDFGWVTSCVSLGTGCGAHELPFARRFLPNLRTFVAVEPDRESVKALRTSFQDGQLPGVEATVVETTVERWNGDKPVDAVILFDVLMHVKQADRLALFQQLFTKCLVPNGIVIIVTECDEPTAGFMRLMDRLGNPVEVYYDEAEKEMLAAGFGLVYTQDIRGTNDLSNPSEDQVKYLQLITGNTASEQEVRAAIADIYRPNQQSTYHKKLAIFKK